MIFEELWPEGLPKNWEIIGSGGKTSFMLGAARSLAFMPKVRSVVYTCSTHLAWPGTADQNGIPVDCPDYPGHLEECADFAETSRLWSSPESKKGLCGLARLNAERSKWIGFSPAELNEISRWPGVDFLLAEADGSKRLPIKAHASHEPVLFTEAEAGVAVIGLRGLGRRIEEGQVHRPELMCRLLDCSQGSVIGEEEFARIWFSYLRLLPAPRLLAVLSQTEGAEPELARRLSAMTAGLWLESPECRSRELKFVSQSRSGLEIINL